MNDPHLHDELSRNPARVVVQTRHGPITGGRAQNGATVFLEIPYSLPPGRFEDPKPLPDDFRYEDKEYIREANYGVQPTNDGQAKDIRPEDKLGLGEPSENPLFLNIVIPPSFPSQTGFPVKIYIHGGFLQFGSPHGLGSQAQYVAAERSEVWVNIGYRLSAFGFLATDKPEPPLRGNYGFKDQWVALEWVKANIAVFGGDPENIQITGLSAGAHSVHQLLLHASRLPKDQQAPFSSAVLQSNAILNSPQTPQEHRHQFNALSRALDLDPSSPNVLSTLRDPSKVPWHTITHLIETDGLGSPPFGTFRGCLSDDWWLEGPDCDTPMAWQRSGGLARGLREHGVRSVVVGDLEEEWYLYSIAHPISAVSDLKPNLRRYFPEEVIEGLMDAWARKLPSVDSEGVEKELLERVFGEMLSVGQVHLPVRVLARDLHNAGFPVLRYVIKWAPEQGRVGGYVTHGADRPLWALRIPTLMLSDKAVETAKMWVDRVDTETKAIEKEGRPLHDVQSVLMLREDKTIEWAEDEKWDEMTSLFKILLGEM